MNNPKFKAGDVVKIISKTSCFLGAPSDKDWIKREYACDFYAIDKVVFSKDENNFSYEIKSDKGTLWHFAERDLAFMPPIKKECEFKIGDTVRCVEPMHPKHTGSSFQGGAGWKYGNVFVINSISQTENECHVLWEKGIKAGVYSCGVEKYSPPPSFPDEADIATMRSITKRFEKAFSENPYKGKNYRAGFGLKLLDPIYPGMIRHNEDIWYIKETGMVRRYPWEKIDYDSMMDLFRNAFSAHYTNNEDTFLTKIKKFMKKISDKMKAALGDQVAPLVIAGYRDEKDLALTNEGMVALLEILAEDPTTAAKLVAKANAVIAAASVPSAAVVA